jgi:hypothetical protein
VRFIDEKLSIHNVEQLLQNFPQLTHFEIKCNGASDDIADGYRWQLIIQSFTIFNFKFDVNLDSIEQTLNSFRTSFWLEEKRWFVAYHNRCLFSLSSHDLTDIEIISDASIYSTICDNTINYDCERSILPRAVPINNKFRFTHIKALQLKWCILPTILSSFIDLSYVERLTLISCTRDILKFIAQKMPRLHSLVIPYEETVDFCEQIYGIRMEQIRTLQMNHRKEQISYAADILSYSFPYVKHLSAMRIKSRSYVIHIIKKFKQLSSISFEIHGSLDQPPKYSDFEPDLIISDIKQFTNSSFQCRAEVSSYDKERGYVHLWIDESVSISSLMLSC